MPLFATIYCLIFHIFYRENEIKTIEQSIVDLNNEKDVLLEEKNTLKQNDFVIGSRYIRDGKSDYNGIRDFLSRSANKLCSFLLKMPFKEFTTSYRIYSNKSLKTLSTFKLNSEDYSALIEFFFNIYY